jgi:glutamine synthetase
VFCAAVIRGVDKFAGLLRAAVASASNDHRLGANEAPPAIISIFLGEQLTDVFAQIEKGEAKSSKKKGTLAIGVDSLPSLPKDAGDRNRTSPFAFTGNKFEFRAVASNQSIAGPLVVLNTIVAESLDYIATELEKSTKGNDAKLNSAVQKLLQQIIKEHGKVIFNGNNYSEEWHSEAARRSLPNLKTSIEALPTIGSKEVVALFEKYKVLSKRETHSRMDIYIEQYCKAVNVEANLVAEIAKTSIYPAAMRYQGELAATCASLKAAGSDVDTGTLDEVSGLIKGLRKSIAGLEKATNHNGASKPLDEAKHFCDDVLPAMQEVRKYADQLECVVADDLWPLPTYQEMLFIK